MAINVLGKAVDAPSVPTTADKSLVEAPLQIELRFRLPMPTNEAFDWVAYRLPEWFQAIDSLTWNNAQSTSGTSVVGVHSTRTCSIGGKQLCEEMVAFEPGHTYSYKADMTRSTMKMPIRNHLGTFEIQSTRDGSLVTWRQYFRATWPLGGMIRWYMRSRMMLPALRTLIAKVGGEIMDQQKGQACDCRSQ